MRRRHFLSGLLAATTIPGAAQAQDFVASVIAQLKKQGFRSVVEKRTLLGRVRLTASRANGVREIIINPGTGEILRDLWTPTSRAASKIEIIEDKSGASGRDDNGSGNDNDDEGGKDDDDEGGGESDDERGGGNSGSGGGDRGGSSSGNDSGGDDEDDDDNDED